MTEPRSGAGESTPSPADRKRESTRAWRERNKEHVVAYNRLWKQEHREAAREHNRESERRRKKRQRAIERKRERGRAYYAANPEHLRARMREWRAKRLAADPMGYRAAERERMRAWRAAHGEQVLAANRARDADDPSGPRERSRNYYRRHAQDRLAAQKAFFAEHPEKRREYQERWRRKDRWRRANGLPTWKLHRTTAKERAVNRFAADSFFAKKYTRGEIRTMRLGPPTPDGLLAEFWRDCDRARAAHHWSQNPKLQERVRAAMGEQAAVDAENARMDAIAREVNERLRRVAPPRRDHGVNPPTPLSVLWQLSSQQGLNR
ncbi:hypothetical protein [Microbacterium deminutum]|uniref:Uncharacterized protein n=1 Tax=Microbacterium deminutum TaxID=344164 RepID=A0ABP5CI61_9MICO